jgi:alkyl hydroperoxide reductase subunit D
VVIEGGVGEDGVHDAIRIAATVQAAAVALELEGVARHATEPRPIQPGA